MSRKSSVSDLVSCMDQVWNITSPFMSASEMLRTSHTTSGIRHLLMNDLVTQGMFVQLRTTFRQKLTHSRWMKLIFKIRMIVKFLSHIRYSMAITNMLMGRGLPEGDPRSVSWQTMLDYWYDD